MSVLTLYAEAAATAGSVDTHNGFTLVVGIIGALLSLPCWYVFVKGFTHMVKTIMVGQKTYGHTDKLPLRVWTMFREIAFHTKMAKKPGVAIAHWFVMVGFLLGSLVWFEAYIQTFWPAGGWPILRDLVAWHFIDEILGLGTTLGILSLIIVRQTQRGKERLNRFYGSDAKAAYFVEGVVLIEGLGMMMVKAGKLATYEPHHAIHWSNFVTGFIAQLLPASAAMVSIFALIKLLSGMVWLFVVGRNLTWGVAWHRFLAFANIFLKRNADGYNALGAAKPMTSDGEIIDLEEADPEEDSMGTGVVTDHSWKALLDFTSCTECGRCQEQCPAWNTTKPLSPKLLVNRLRDHAYTSAPYLLRGDTPDGEGPGPEILRTPLVGEGDEGVIDPDVLWSCTNCGACVEQCPVDIEHIDHIVDMRRYQVLVESDFPTELAGLFKNLETKGNPWGQNASTRADWIDEVRKDGIVVPVWGEDVENFDDTEYLFWVGCAGAYDDNAKKTTKAVAEMLYTAGVKFTVLSQAEGCTGDSARRAGNEFLFQMLAEQNVEQLSEVFEGVPPKQRKIVVTCAHCFNTFKNEYPELGGNYKVLHHTQLLNQLVRENRLQPVASGQGRQVTYHDPCFLGRHNKVFEAPRELIGASGAELVEMDRNRNTGFCCGAGGARMWMEETIGERININRTEEALATGASQIAIGCPFCKTMMNDGVNNLADDDNKPDVVDIAQMIRDSVLVDGSLPEPHKPEWLEKPERGYVEPEPEPEPEEAEEEEVEAAAPATESKPAASGAKGGAPAPGGAKGAPAPGGAKGAPAPGGAKGGAPAPGGAKGGAPAPGGAKGGAPAPGGAKGAPAPGGAKGAPAPGGAKGAPAPGGAKGGAPAPGGAKKGAPAPGGAKGAPAPGGAKKGAPVPGGARSAKPTADTEPSAEAEAPAPQPTVGGAPIPGGARRGAPAPGGARTAPAKPTTEDPQAEAPEETSAEESVAEFTETSAEQPKVNGAPIPGGARRGAPAPGGARTAPAKPGVEKVRSQEEPAADKTTEVEDAEGTSTEDPVDIGAVDNAGSDSGTTAPETNVEETTNPAVPDDASGAEATNDAPRVNGVPLPGHARRNTR